MSPGDGALKCLEVCPSMCTVNKYLQVQGNSSQLLRDWLHSELSEYPCKLLCFAVTGTLS